MELLELDSSQVKVLLKKAYEWLGKISNPKRHHRMDYYKTTHCIKKFKKFVKNNTKSLYRPNRTALELIIAWFARCPPRTDNEALVFTYVGLIYKLHGHKLANTSNK